MSFEKLSKALGTTGALLAVGLEATWWRMVECEREKMQILESARASQEQLQKVILDLSFRSQP